MTDHACHCVHEHHDPKQRMLDAKAHCEARGVRFTPLREEVYGLILEADKPLGAYDLISALQSARHSSGAKNKNIAPPTIYRSLEFLLAEGLIHQLSSMNAYVPCCHPRSQHAAAFLICQKCQSVEECSNVPVDAIVNFAKDDAGFDIERTVIELKGVCRACR
ncbi:transcriptional repressor [Moraxella sp. K127]|uniref:Fur family transcriptional regulator n=1 Tax=Moraxella lacunata TaxID=477 RepID=A0A1V4H0V4_MORLA|nr:MULTISPECIES: Fur family transcriptional regulator [Moraxella]MBE9589924.1 transcriptional repressor [Moraxella sp. K127]OPH38559.1 Fur family transcriptional regulator [Moraxella lacunata]STZ00614.1 Zinc uptake regulation protein [Moraxella lacunata]